MVTKLSRNPRFPSNLNKLALGCSKIIFIFWLHKSVKLFIYSNNFGETDFVLRLVSPSKFLDSKKQRPDSEPGIIKTIQSATIGSLFLIQIISPTSRSWLLTSSKYLLNYTYY
jgi:hypothetical protein